MMVLFAASYATAGATQGPPTAQFQAWARAHASTITFDDRSVADANIDEFAPLKASIGSARIIALGEPFHGGHEPLAVRNRLIRYCVTRLACTAVALETGFSNSKRLYDYVLGRTTESDSAIKAAFSYGFGGIKENIDLLHWLRDYNTRQPAGKKVRLYGIDVTGALFDPLGFRSLQSVLTYLEHTDTVLAGKASRSLSGFLPAFRSDSLPLLAAEQQDHIAGEISDLEALLRLHRLDLIRGGTIDDYEWAVRQAYNAGLDFACMRSISPAVLRHLKANDWDSLAAAPPHFLDPTELREASIADNVAWILAHEGKDGRVFLFAADGHLQGQPIESPATHGIASFFNGYRTAGMFLRSAFGTALVTIGTYVGTGEGFRGPRPLNADGVEGLLSSLQASYFLDLRGTTPPASVLQWLSAMHTVNEGGSLMLRSAADAHDLILYVDRVTPAKRAT